MISIESLNDATTAGPSGTSNNSSEVGRTTRNNKSIIDVDQYASEMEKTKKSKRKRSPLFEKSESESDSESDAASSYLDGQGGHDTPTLPAATRVTRRMCLSYFILFTILIYILFQMLRNAQG